MRLQNSGAMCTTNENGYSGESWGAEETETLRGVMSLVISNAAGVLSVLFASEPAP